MKNDKRLQAPAHKKQPSLLFCIAMDIVGYASYSIPLLGEVADIVWAPLSAIIFLATFGVRRGGLGSIFNFVEELLPGTDFIPSFTLMWFWQYGSSFRLTGSLKK